MKTKLDMAHEYVMACLKNPNVILSGDNLNVIKNNSWAYVDDMQTEADKRVVNGVPEAISDACNDWQPDWSQAPKHMNYFVVDDQGFGMWFIYKPDFIGSRWLSNIKDPIHIETFKLAPSFSYQGNWKDSLRKRP